MVILCILNYEQNGTHPITIGALTDLFDESEWPDTR